MLEEIACNYAAFLKSDISTEFHSVQDVIDNMLTRLEELDSVLQIIKLKNSECSTILSEDIIKYRNEIIALSKKICTVNKVVQSLHTNIEVLEKHVEKAEQDFKAYNDYKIKNLLKPFLKKGKESIPDISSDIIPGKVQFESVMNNFEEK